REFRSFGGTSGEDNRIVTIGPAQGFQPTKAMKHRSAGMLLYQRLPTRIPQGIDFIYIHQSGFATVSKFCSSLLSVAGLPAGDLALGANTRTTPASCADRTRPQTRYCRSANSTMSRYRSRSCRRTMKTPPAVK